jgi:polysaccharide biosynthesis transport protein
MRYAPYVRAVRAHLPLVLALTLVGLAGAGLASWIQTPVYTARVQLVVSFNAPITGGNELRDATPFLSQRVQTYAKVASDPVVTAKVVDRLGLPSDPGQLSGHIHGSAAANATVLVIAVTDSSASRARDVANAVLAVLPGVIEQIETPTKGGQSPIKVTALSPAGTPGAPDSPKTLVNLALGTVLGLAAGIGAVVALRMRARRSGPADAPRAGAASPVAGEVEKPSPVIPVQPRPTR